MVLVSILINNVSSVRKYPTFGETEVCICFWTLGWLLYLLKWNLNICNVYLPEKLPMLVAVHDGNGSSFPSFGFWLSPEVETII